MNTDASFRKEGGDRVSKRGGKRAPRKKEKNIGQDETTRLVLNLARKRGRAQNLIGRKKVSARF